MPLNITDLPRVRSALQILYDVATTMPADYRSSEWWKWYEVDHKEVACRLGETTVPMPESIPYGGIFLVVQMWVIHELNPEPPRCRAPGGGWYSPELKWIVTPQRTPEFEFPAIWDGDLPNKQKLAMEKMCKILCRNPIPEYLLPWPAQTGDRKFLALIEEAQEALKVPRVPKRAKGQSINERMLVKIHSDPESVHWSARKWAAVLECRESTIASTPTWKGVIKTTRILAKAERVEEQEKKSGSKHSKQSQ